MTIEQNTTEAAQIIALETLLHASVAAIILGYTGIEMGGTRMTDSGSSSYVDLQRGIEHGSSAIIELASEHPEITKPLIGPFMLKHAAHQHVFYENTWMQQLPLEVVGGDIAASGYPIHKVVEDYMHWMIDGETPLEASEAEASQRLEPLLVGYNTDSGFQNLVQSHIRLLGAAAIVEAPSFGYHIPAMSSGVYDGNVPIDDIELAAIIRA